MPKIVCPKCSHEFTTEEVLGSKRRLVLEAIEKQPMRFNELKRRVGISGCYLTQVLERLLKEEKVLRIEQSPQHVTYKKR